MCCIMKAQTTRSSVWKWVHSLKASPFNWVSVHLLYSGLNNLRCSESTKDTTQAKSPARMNHVVINFVVFSFQLYSYTYLLNSCFGSVLVRKIPVTRWEMVFGGLIHVTAVLCLLMGVSIAVEHGNKWVCVSALTPFFSRNNNYVTNAKSTVKTPCRRTLPSPKY